MEIIQSELQFTYYQIVPLVIKLHLLSPLLNITFM